MAHSLIATTELKVIVWRTRPDNYQAFCPQLDIQAPGATQEVALELLRSLIQTTVERDPSVLTRLRPCWAHDIVVEQNRTGRHAAPART